MRYKIHVYCESVEDSGSSADNVCLVNTKTALSQGVDFIVDDVIVKEFPSKVILFSYIRGLNYNEKGNVTSNLMMDALMRDCNDNRRCKVFIKPKGSFDVLLLRLGYLVQDARGEIPNLKEEKSEILGKAIRYYHCGCKMRSRDQEIVYVCTTAKKRSSKDFIKLGRQLNG